jgi:hypothetical protein
MRILKRKTQRKEIEVSKYLLIGGNEWCALPELGIHMIKAKIDTGAKTSAIHAYDIKSYFLKRRKYVRFKVHPLQRRNDISISCHAEIIDERHIMSSNGHIENRYVIRTPIILGTEQWMIQLTLSNRDPLRFRMLLGREALNGRFLIEPNKRLLQGKPILNAVK